jgi:hypothetical protein
MIPKIDPDLSLPPSEPGQLSPKKFISPEDKQAVPESKSKQIEPSRVPDKPLDSKPEESAEQIDGALYQLEDSKP